MWVVVLPGAGHALSAGHNVFEPDAPNSTSSATVGEPISSLVARRLAAKLNDRLKSQLVVA